MLKNLIIVHSLFLLTLQQIPDASIAHPLHQAYNNFWDGALGGKGYWGDTPQKDPNVFSSNFDKKGVNEVYNLNSLSPFTNQRELGFESLVPYYTPFGSHRYTYYPTKSNYINNKQLGSFSYDINEPRYSKLYEDYFNFFNTNLDSLENIEKYHKDNNDLNNDHLRKMENPDSFNYEDYFDGFDESSTLLGPNLKYLPYKNDFKPADRKLLVQEKKKKLMKNILEDINYIENKKKEKQIERKLVDLKHELKNVQKDEKLQKSIYNELYQHELNLKPNYPQFNDLKKNPYTLDSKAIF